MPSESSLQRWLSVQALESQAGHDLLLSLADASGCPTMPSADALARARQLHAQADELFPAAMAELEANRRALAEMVERHEKALSAAHEQVPYLLGMHQAYYMAVQALIEVHPDKDALRLAMRRLFEVDAAPSNAPGPASFQQGLADARNLIRLASLLEPPSDDG